MSAATPITITGDERVIRAMIREAIQAWGCAAPSEEVHLEDAFIDAARAHAEKQDFIASGIRVWGMERFHAEMLAVMEQPTVVDVPKEAPHLRGPIIQAHAETNGIPPTRQRPSLRIAVNNEFAGGCTA